MEETDVGYIVVIEWRSEVFKGITNLLLLMKRPTLKLGSDLVRVLFGVYREIMLHKYRIVSTDRLIWHLLEHEVMTGSGVAAELGYDWPNSITNGSTLETIDGVGEVTWPIVWDENVLRTVSAAMYRCYAAGMGWLSVDFLLCRILTGNEEETQKRLFLDATGKSETELTRYVERKYGEMAYLRDDINVSSGALLYDSQEITCRMLATRVLRKPKGGAYAPYIGCLDPCARAVVKGAIKLASIEKAPVTNLLHLTKSWAVAQKDKGFLHRLGAQMGAVEEVMRRNVDEVTGKRMYMPGLRISIDAFSALGRSIYFAERNALRRVNANHIMCGILSTMNSKGVNALVALGIDNCEMRRVLCVEERRDWDLLIWPVDADLPIERRICFQRYPRSQVKKFVGRV